MRSIPFLTVVSVLITLALAGQPAPPPAPTSVEVRLAAFNVLAPSWASPSYYPAQAASLLAPWQTRFQTVMNYVNANLLAVDAFAFQETEVTVNSYVGQQLGNGYSYFSVFHDDNYWASWITVDPPFARNGVSIAVNLNKYDSCTYVDKALGTGNHAAIAICRNKLLNRWFRFVSTHLDSDYGGRRGTEAKTLSDYLDAENSHSNYLTVIAGDFNADTDSGVIKQRITNNGYQDVFKALGNYEQTHPWSTQYNGNSMWGIIDHICVRGQGFTPVSATVHSSNLYTLYPDTNGQGGANEVQRIVLNLQYTGSDHFPISAVLNVTV